mgnify:CR=1 FL=1
MAAASLSAATFGHANQGGTGATPADLSSLAWLKFDTATNTWSAISQGEWQWNRWTVLALAANGNSVFVGGAFTTVNSGGTGATPEITANNVAKFDTSTNTWSALRKATAMALIPVSGRWW